MGKGKRQPKERPCVVAQGEQACEGRFGADQRWEQGGGRQKGGNGQFAKWFLRSNREQECLGKETKDERPEAKNGELKRSWVIFSHQTISVFSSSHKFVE